MNKQIGALIFSLALVLPACEGGDLDESANPDGISETSPGGADRGAAPDGSSSVDETDPSADAGPGDPSPPEPVAAGDCVYRHSKRDGTHPVSLRYNTPLLRHDGFVIGLEPGTFALPTST